MGGRASVAEPLSDGDVDDAAGLAAPAPLAAALAAAARTGGAVMSAHKKAKTVRSAVVRSG